MSIKFIKKNSINRIIIFGSSGIISLNLQEKLRKNKFPYKVIGSSKINLKNKDCVNKLKKSINKKDCVIFISAEAPVKNFDMLKNNLKMAFNFCNTMNYNSLKHLVYVSSDAVYKDIDKPMSEETKTEPNSLHGIMHLTRENIFKRIFKDKLLILRPTLIYGVKDNHLGYGPNLFLSKAINRKKIELFGNGEERRDHVYIDDLIEIMIKIIEKKAYGVLNIASGKINSFYKIANLVNKITKNNKKIVKLRRNGPMPHNGYRAFNIKNIKKNFKKIKITLIDKGIKKYYLKKIK